MALSAILNDEPGLEAAPEQLRPIIARCVKKDPRARLQHIGDVRIALEDAHSAGEWRTGCGHCCLSALKHGPSLALVTCVSAALGFIYFFREKPVELPVVRASILAPEGTFFNAAGGFGGGMALSPDGRRLVFSATAKNGKDQL